MVTMIMTAQMVVPIIIMPLITQIVTRTQQMRQPLIFNIFSARKHCGGLAFSPIRCFSILWILNFGSMQLSCENDSTTAFSQERSAVTVFSNSAVLTEPCNASTKTGSPICLPSWCCAQTRSLMYRRPGSDKGKLWTIMTAISLFISPHKTFNA
jgi:hypothetical protein